MKVILRQYRGNICNIGQHYQCCINIGSNILRQYRKTFIAPTYMWLGGVVVKGVGLVINMGVSSTSGRELLG